MSSDQLKILLLEDSAVDAELVQFHLRKHFRPCVFHVAMTEITFKEAMIQFAPQVVLADNSLPQFDAATALSIVKEKYPTTAFIMVTGTVSEEFAAEIIREGADDYILKDRLVRLPAAIDAALHKHQQEKEKQAALLQLIEREEQYRSLVERISDGFMSLDESWKITYMNTVAEDLLGKPGGTLLGKSFWSEFPEHIGGILDTTFRESMVKQRNVFMTEYAVAPDKWIEGTVYPSAEGVTVYFRDINEKKRLEKELQDQEKKSQLEKISVSLAVQEKERNLIGAELHDNVNQILSSTHLLLSILKKVPQRADEIIPRCMDSIAKAVNENRKLAHELVAPDLKNETLLSQVNSLTKSMFLPSGIETRIQYEHFDEKSLSPDQKLALYRIMQEQCSNIIKHAGAKNVWLHLENASNQLTLFIKDDGKGMTETSNSGIGLKNMASRLEVLGGALTTKTAPGQGFMLEVRLPVHR